MFRNRNGARGQGRGARNSQGLGNAGGQGAGFGYGRGRGMGRGRGFFGGNQESNWDAGYRQNQSIEELTANIPTSEKKSWLENFKTHLLHRMSEVDEKLKNY